MQTVWVNNVPCSKDLVALNEFYSNYENLKDYFFDLFIKNRVFYDLVPHKKILLKPNWVLHNRSETDKVCLTTHPNIILVVLEFVLTLKPASIIIGDSPVQSCCWENLLSTEFKDRVNILSKTHQIPISIIDFRNEKWENKKILQKNCRGENAYVLYDLTDESLLDPLSIQNKTFRVGDYDSRETTKNHSIGVHRYLIAKEVIEADIIINLPKLKTHQKAGITNGLKNFVGTIGEKAYLAHHSSNLSKGGGDNYPGRNIFRLVSEFLSELSYRYKGKFIYYLFHYASSVLWRLAPKSNYASMSGAWYGNDTVWRMVLDINKIISFGTLNGEILSIPQRKIITISDAIISGQGDGPLKPIPLAMGMVAISNNDMLLDFVMATLMGFDCGKIPLLKSFVNSINNSNFQIYFNGNRISEHDLSNYTIKTIPPVGWIDKIEHNQ